MGKAELYNYKIYSLEGFLKKLRFQSKEIKECIREWAEHRNADYVNDPNYDFNFLVCYDGRSRDRSRDRNKFIGILGIETSNKNKSCFYLSPLYVEEAYRYIGVGSKLIELSKNIAKKNKYKEISLYCDEKKLFKFYKKQGFRLNEYLEDKNTFEMIAYTDYKERVVDIQDCFSGNEIPESFSATKIEDIISPKSNKDFLSKAIGKEVEIIKDFDDTLFKFLYKGERFFLTTYADLGDDSYIIALSESKLKDKNLSFINVNHLIKAETLIKIKE